MRPQGTLMYITSFSFLSNLWVSIVIPIFPMRKLSPESFRESQGTSLHYETPQSIETERAQLALEP